MQNLTNGGSGDDWKVFIGSIQACRKCALCGSRKNTVIGRGNPHAALMFIGEAPGEQEDEQGLPFVGAAGKLLDLMLRALMISDDRYYIANILKCRPPGNRVPRDDEAEACLPYLRKQVLLVNPRILVCLGASAMKYIIDRDAKITRIRGEWIERKGFYIMPTYHPAALLRDESKKAPMWEDLRKVRQRLRETDNMDMPQ